MSVWITIQHCVIVYHNVHHNPTLCITMCINPTLLPPHPSSRPFRGNKEQRDFKKILSSAVAFLLNMFLCQHYHMFFVCQYIDSVLFTNKNAQSALSGKCINQKGRTVIFTAMIENTVEYVATKMAGGRDRQEMRQFRVLLPPLPSKPLNPLQHVIFFCLH